MAVEKKTSEKTGLNAVIKKVAKECIKCNKCFDECRFVRKYGKPGEIADKCNPRDFNSLKIAFECSLCGLCESVCPAGVDPVSMFIGMRREAARQKKGILKKYTGLIAYEKTGTSKRFSWYGFPDGCDSIFFPGCTLPGTRPETTFNLYKYLKQAVPGIGIVLDCCTKPSHDLGREDFFYSMFGEMTDYLKEQGIKHIFAACPNCYRVFREYGKDFSVQQVYELIMEKGPPTEPNRISGTVTVHDPCVVRHEKDSHEAVRGLIRQAGLDISEMSHSGEKTICCGEGGAVSNASSELAGNWVKLRQKEKNGTRIITYCAGCAGRLSRTMPASHLLDLLFTPDAVMAGKEKVSRHPFTYWNRLRLKKRLKKDRDIVVSRERNFPGRKRID